MAASKKGTAVKSGTKPKQLIRRLQPPGKPKTWVTSFDREEGIVHLTKKRDYATRYFDAKKHLVDNVPWYSRFGYYKIEHE